MVINLKDSLIENFNIYRDYSGFFELLLFLRVVLNNWFCYYIIYKIGFYLYSFFVGFYFNYRVCVLRVCLF